MTLNTAIPKNSVEIQTGLLAHLNTFIFNGQERHNYRLYSAEGYCFWEVDQPENYDEEGNLLPIENRVFATFAVVPYMAVEDINKKFVSVPIEDWYENVTA